MRARNASLLIAGGGMWSRLCVRPRHRGLQRLVLGAGAGIRRQALWCALRQSLCGNAQRRHSPLLARWMQGRTQNASSCAHRAGQPASLSQPRCARRLRSTRSDLRLRSAYRRGWVAFGATRAHRRRWRAPVPGHMCYRKALSTDDMPKDLRWSPDALRGTKHAYCASSLARPDEITCYSALSTGLLPEHINPAETVLTCPPSPPMQSKCKIFRRSSLLQFS